ncbi:MAG: TrbG/VirB9 family P-type conjugative transfer protein [Pseudomonadota bacterium]
MKPLVFRMCWIMAVSFSFASLVHAAPSKEAWTKKNAAKKSVARKHSPHFKTIVYNGEIITVHTKVGRMLEIEFGKSETSIEFAMGDREAWSVKTVANVMFIKPKAVMADTNLRVITNRRKYWFDLVMTENVNIVPYHIDFKYPAEIVPATAPSPEEVTRRERDVIEMRLSAAMRAAIGAMGPAKENSRVLNGNYHFIGPNELLPLATYDNGEMTYIEFAPNNPMPVVFAVDEDGSESRVNFHVEKDIFVVHRTAKRLVFRRGAAAACLINVSFRATGANPSQTSSVDVQRKVKGDTYVP